MCKHFYVQQTQSIKDQQQKQATEIYEWQYSKYYVSIPRYQHMGVDGVFTG